MKSEALVQSEVRLEAASKHNYLWRNNVGAGTLTNGLFMRWGLANESEQMNDRLKSSDLVGWRSVVITEAMVGKTIAQFVSREIKHEGWQYTGTPVERAQKAWLDLVNRSGGDGQFATTTGTL